LIEAACVEPEKGEEKFIALGQLCQGHESLNYFQRAIDVIQANSDPDISKTKILSSLHCSMAEIYMTDLCETENAEQKCESCISTALSVDPEGYEALQTMTNMRLSQNRIEEAYSLLERSISIWQNVPFEDEEYPSYEFRLVCSRLLVELGKFVQAKELLEQLSQEDDEIEEVWYLLALSQYSLDDRESAMVAIDNALTCCSTQKNEDMMDAIHELCEALGVSTRASGDEHSDDADCCDYNSDAVSLNEENKDAMEV